MNAVIAPKRHRITVDEFHRMGEAGIFSEDERVELVEGEIIDMAPIGPFHANVVDELMQLFVKKLPNELRLRAQNPITLDRKNEPQPDLAIVKNKSYISSHPAPEDVLLLIEVADTSLDYDRNVKIPLYARHKIPEVWLVNLEEKTIEVFRHPASQGYSEARIIRAGENLQASTPSGIEIDPSRLFQ